MKHRHEMPFGAQLLPGGGARFRLWAPSARAVDLVLGERLLPMERLAEGWFERLEPSAGAGSLYRYRIDGGALVPDPASRFQPQDAEGPSEVIDPGQFEWRDEGWQGRPWREAVVYELHVGCFSSSHSYQGVKEKLPELAALGVTALELMPLADFPGRRNWGYDGVLPYAPDSAYGRPEELKVLVQAAHEAGLMVFLDVVYNHFGPQGNFLSVYAPQFFSARHQTPWGAAINFDGEASGPVRRYFVENALYWLEEYRFDGLRFDAVHAIIDESPKHVLLEISQRIHELWGNERQVHLILENDANQARFLGPGKLSAQWNDDSHHAFHVLATGESDGYYAAYADAPARQLARCLAEGFAYQGEVSPFTGRQRGEPSTDLPPASFVDFLQNHDQTGNRAFGERLAALLCEKRKSESENNKKHLQTLAAILLLSPSIPLLFMGEEWGCRQPFLFFCDFHGELADAVRQGRREEFARFAAFRDPGAREHIPDPLAPETFDRCVLRWEDRESEEGRAWLRCYASLLLLRKQHVAPRKAASGSYRMLGERAFRVAWPLDRGEDLLLVANVGSTPVEIRDPPAIEPIWSSGKPGAAWSAAWWIAARAEG